MKENRKKIIIDTDCGSDDAMAIAMALNDENYEIVMITTVSGNVRMKQATLNTLTTLKVNDSYYPPVYEGCDEMLVRDWVGAAETHGNDGMGDLGLVDYSLKPQEGNAVIKMLEAEETTKSGIVLAGTAKEKPQIAKVIAVGPGGVVDGKEVEMYIKVGDRVITSKYSGTEIKLDGEEYTVVRQSDILAVVE